MCTDRKTGAECKKRVASVLTTQPNDRRMASWLVQKVLLQKQVPCLLEDEDLESSRLLYCP